MMVNNIKKRKNKKYALIISVILFLFGIAVYNYSPKTEGVLLTLLALGSHFLGSVFLVFFGGTESTYWLLFLLVHFIQYIIIFFLILGLTNIFLRKT